jgi:hypothetical protein
VPRTDHFDISLSCALIGLPDSCSLDSSKFGTTNSDYRSRPRGPSAIPKLATTLHGLRSMAASVGRLMKIQVWRVALDFDSALVDHRLDRPFAGDLSRQ